ncbi:MAG: glycosyltransferase family 4 protein [Gammaproteobacteria bacterium]|nr:glycosyltransferase family 4 protein [Gammaproteobacteria bacterium]
MLTELSFHVRRNLSLLRRAMASLQTRGWPASLRRLRGDDVAQSHARRSNNAGHAAIANPQGRGILVVDAATPRPDRDSGSLRLRNLMLLMLAEGWQVSFLPDNGRDAGSDSAALRALGIETLDRSRTGTIPRWLRRHGTRFAIVVLSRHYVAAHWLPLLRAVLPNATIIFDTVDLHFVREQREAELHDSTRLQRRALATRQRELRLVNAADLCWVVSDWERTLLHEMAPDARVLVLSNIVDTVDHSPPFDSRHGLLFVGGHLHPPNNDAVKWLIGDIFPRISQQLPEVQLHLVGADPPPEVQAAAARVRGIVVHGQVPDLAPLLDGCRITLAPLRFGAGIKGKINQSMAHGLPVVATPCAVEGMHLRDGEDVLVAKNAGDFAAAVVRLYRDGTLWARLSRNGLDNVRAHFSPEAARRTLRQSLPAKTRAHGPAHG